MKRNWTSPEVEELEMKETAYNSKMTNNVDAFVYDDITGEPVFDLGYKSGQAAR